MNECLTTPQHKNKMDLESRLLRLRSTHYYKTALSLNLKVSFVVDAWLAVSNFSLESRLQGFIICIFLEFSRDSNKVLSLDSEHFISMRPGAPIELFL